jgi:hypothetical protein
LSVTVGRLMRQVSENLDLRVSFAEARDARSAALAPASA